MVLICSRVLSSRCPLLEEIHLPVLSNHALRSLSEMSSLKSLRSDRTKFFNRRGLWHLCHPESETHLNLESLHLGVFKHKHFNKLDVSKFFACMKKIKSFSLMDEDRPKLGVGNMNYR